MSKHTESMRYIARVMDREAREPAGSNGTEPDSTRTVPYASVSREKVSWLWPGRIPLGMLTLLIGDPGLGKSVLTVMVAARLSRAGADALILSAEDSHSATIRPRLEAVEADLERVHRVEVRRDGVEDGIALPDDADKLDRMVAETGARLVIVDPLMAHLPEAVNSWRDQSIRRALAPLRRMAEERRCAVVLIAHLNKARGGDALYRAGGSIGIPAAVRSALLLARDPQDPDGDRGSRRVLAHVKCNVGEQAESLACEIRTVQLNGDEQLIAPKIAITGKSTSTAEDLLDRPSGEERTERDDAVEFLEAELADGPQPVKQIRAAAGAAGISWRTVERAKAAVGVSAQRVGGAGADGRWEWSLDKDRQPKDRHPNISAVAALGETASDSGIQGSDEPKTATRWDMAPLGGKWDFEGER